MARVVVLGAGVSGHTAAQVVREKLKGEPEVVVVSPNRSWNWIPSNIWVGVGVMQPEDVTLELAPVYAKMGITHEQARAVAILRVHKLPRSQTPSEFAARLLRLPGA